VFFRVHKKTPPERGFLEVDYGTRTHDLLHGKSPGVVMVSHDRCELAFLGSLSSG
jgi:hypothetical protein